MPDSTIGGRSKNKEKETEDQMKREKTQCGEEVKIFESGTGQIGIWVYVQ